MTAKEKLGVVWFCTICLAILWIVSWIVRWFGSTSPDPKAPAPYLGVDSAYINCSVTTTQFDYSPLTHTITMQIIVRPPYWFGNLVSAETLHPMAQEEAKRQIEAFIAQNPNLDVQQISFVPTHTTSRGRSAEKGNRSTSVTVLYSVHKKG